MAAETRKRACAKCKSRLIPVVYVGNRVVYWICRCLIPGTVVAGDVRDYCAQSYKLDSYDQSPQRGRKGECNGR